VADEVYTLGTRAVARVAAALWVGCGAEDPLYESSMRFVDACATAAVPVATSFTPGSHDWALWDAEIQKVLAWLPL